MNIFMQIIELLNEKKITINIKEKYIITLSKTGVKYRIYYINKK